MIDRIMKKSGEKSFLKDLEKIDRTKLDKSICEDLDISYTDKSSNEQKLDIYYSKIKIKKPILIDIHGGGFISNDKEINHLFGNYMAQNGFVVFNLNYRLAYPEYTVFDQIEDIDSAVNWILANAEKYGGDINSMYIAGHSSAGVLAVTEAMLCNNTDMLRDYNLKERHYNYKGIILDCGLMHFYKRSIAYTGMRNMVFPKNYSKNEKYKYLIFENREEIKNLPKTVLITNKKDALKNMTYWFKKVLEHYGVPHLLIDDGKDGHMGIIYKPYSEDNLKKIEEIKHFLND
ncbi:MAG: alpha/beta hydrolase [Treponema sp.]|nr:alpha/beta hydrolase [Treponema sp.]